MMPFSQARSGVSTLAVMVTVFTTGIVGGMSAMPKGAAAQGQPGAASSAQQSPLSVTIGAGVGVAPDYEGSDDYRLLPLLALRAGDRGYTVETDRRGVKADLVPSRAIILGPILRYEGGRQDVEDERVDRLPEVDAGLEAGLQAGYVFEGVGGPRAGLRLGLELVQEVAGGHGGMLVTPSIGWSTPVGQALRLSLGASTTWASDDYMENFFGIDARGAAASGLARYDAGAGIKDVGLSTVASYQVTDRVMVTGILSYKHLLGDAADSPVVQDRGTEHQAFFGLTVGYRF